MNHGTRHPQQADKWNGQMSDSQEQAEQQCQALSKQTSGMVKQGTHSLNNRARYCLSKQTSQTAEPGTHIILTNGTGHHLREQTSGAAKGGTHKILTNSARHRLNK
ncbi:hypothetical protein B0H17DRAFT_1032111 [Mycena rosella]|uniref:Uncharacterized protein n=1 Tax=Mycena rosella TaxID=1033263 RepID=A0AAD7GZ09_MYCRO|nr:hypothetical protein B0H17DRAFT_1032111 [Mycena rosella]